MQNPAEQLKTIPLTILIPDLLKQFNKLTLLGKHSINLSKIEMNAIAEALTEQKALPEKVPVINNALYEIVQESITLLDNRFKLTFEESLKTTDISDVAEWQTTADFLEIANEKSNAELRISAGCSLMVFLADTRLADYLLAVIRVDDGLNDVDAMIAKRALSHYAKLDIDAEDWLAKIEVAIK